MGIIKTLEKNKLLQFTKEYFTIILAVPYLIGGFRQLFKLFLISYDLFIFFSFSQLLIDGIITTIKILFLIVFLLQYKTILEKYATGETAKISLRTYNIILAVLIISYIIAIFLLNLTNTFTTDRNFSRFFAYSILILLSINQLITLKDTVYKYFPYMGIILFSTFLPIPITFDNRIENIELLTEKIKKQHKNVTLSYYNDQYLFFETERMKKNNKIIVVKMDDIFNDGITDKAIK